MTERALFQNLRASPLFLELLVVILGVFIALAADSWWQGRQERARVDSYLQAIQADLQITRSAVADAISEATDSLESLIEFNTLMRFTEKISEDQPMLEITLPGLIVPTGMLKALVATGDVKLLRDETLRAALIRQHARTIEAKSRVDHYARDMTQSGREGYYVLERLYAEGYFKAGT